MQNLDVNFSSLRADYNYLGIMNVSRVNQDAYLYLNSEYRHPFIDEFERRVVVEKRKRKSLKEKLSDLKLKLVGTGEFVHIPESSSTHQFIAAEYRQNCFMKDFDNSYIVPSKDFSKTKTRK